MDDIITDAQLSLIPPENTSPGAENSEILYEGVEGTKSPEASDGKGLDHLVSSSGPHLLVEHSTKTHSQPTKLNLDLQNDLETLSKTELGKKYKGEYTSWNNMKRRRKTHGRIIHPDFEDFRSFLLHMGPKPSPSHTLDRRDNSNPEYSPENCRWAGKALQSANRSNTIWLTDNDGDTRSLTNWAAERGTSAKTLRDRRDKGWSDHDVIYGRRRSTPVTSRTSKLSRRRYAEWNGFVDDADEAEQTYRKESEPGEIRIAWLFRYVVDQVNSGKEDRQCLREIRQQAVARYGPAKAEELMEGVRRGIIIKYPGYKPAPWWESDSGYNPEDDGGEMGDFQ